MRIITITSDFGIENWYVACMKGVILSLNPNINLIDITHAIPAQDIHSAGLIISNSTPYFPPLTIHLVVVDPEVGSSSRLPIIAKLSNNQIYVLPNNGLLSFLLQKFELLEAYAIENRNYIRENVSSTFHGRDVFSPVCGHISLGIGLSEFGQRIDQVKVLRINQCWKENKQVCGEIVFVDCFGNLISNICKSDIGEERVGEVAINGVVIRKSGKTYCDAEVGELIVIFSSEGVLEVSANQANASIALNAKIGTPLRVLLGNL